MAKQTKKGDSVKGKVKEVSAAELKKTLKEPTGAERRTAPRVEARWDVEVPMATWEQFRRVYTTNISEGGLMFTVAPPAKVPAALDVTLTLPNGAKVKFQSEVRHVAKRQGGSEFEVGVQFMALDKDAKKALEAALASAG